MRRTRPLNHFNLDHDRAQLDTRPPLKFGYGSFENDLASIARETGGEPIARSLPAERSHLAEQRRRTLLDAYLRVVESPSQTGPPRVARTFSPTRSRRPQLPRLGLALLTIHLLGRLFTLLARLATRTLSH